MFLNNTDASQLEQGNRNIDVSKAIETRHHTLLHLISNLNLDLDLTSITAAQQTDSDSLYQDFYILQGVKNMTKTYFLCYPHCGREGEQGNREREGLS